MRLHLHLLTAMGNFIKASFIALSSTYAVLTPDLWPVIPPPKAPFDEFSGYMQMSQKKINA